MAKTYEAIGKEYREQGKLEEARAQSQKGLDLHIKLLGHEHPDVSKGRLAYGSILRGLGRYEEALVQYQKALEALIAVHGYEHQIVGATYQEIALCMGERERERDFAGWTVPRAWKIRKIRRGI